MIGMLNTIFILFLLINNSFSAFSDLFRIPQVRTHEAAIDPVYHTLDFIGLVEQYGYPAAEDHQVVTEDGYILRIFRMLGKNEMPHQFKQRPVVFVQHGMAGSADHFVLFGPNMSLAFTLLNAGYDVWLGNSRGNTYSRRHKTISPDADKFWDFGLDEEATLDTSAAIDYILHYTKRPSMTFVGYSTGATLISILLSDRPEYNSKINLVVMLGPLFKWRTLTLSRFFILMQMALIKTAVGGRNFEVFFQGILSPLFFKHFCMLNEDSLIFCNFVINNALGYDSEQITPENQFTLYKYWPAGISTRVWYYIVQQIGSGPPYHYDFGNHQLNLKYYGQTYPPPYNTTNIVTPIVIFNSLNDRLIIEDDVQFLIESMPNAKILHEHIEYQQFGHVHYVLAKDMNKLIYNRLVEILEKFHQRKLVFD